MQRPGRWDLLGHKSDPIDADTDQLRTRIAYYANMADIIRTEAKTLHSIADGQSLKGKYADKLRKDSGDVAADLDKVHGRYQAVADALTTYQPKLQPALDESSAALADAVRAEGDLTTAEALPHTDGTTLTDDQKKQNTTRDSAVDTANAAMTKARTRLQNALDPLDTAGRAAAATIKAAWNDGLKDSGWDKFVHGFLKFIAILVKIFTYIGIALAAIALIIPGVGEALMAAMAAAVTAVTLVGHTILAATGNGSWMDVVMDVVGIATMGAGKVFGKAIETSVAKGMGKGVGTLTQNGDKLAALGKAQRTWDTLAAKPPGSLTTSEEAFLNAGRPTADIKTMGDLQKASATYETPGLSSFVNPSTARATWSEYAGHTYSIKNWGNAVTGQEAAAKAGELRTAVTPVIGSFPISGTVGSRIAGALDKTNTYYQAGWGIATDTGVSPGHWGDVTNGMTIHGGDDQDPGVADVPSIFSST